MTTLTNLTKKIIITSPDNGGAIAILDTVVYYKKINDPT